MVKEAEYCGLISGKSANKAYLFANFYGKLATAPMIEECPVNMELRLYDVLDFPTHDIFIGELVETYADEGIINGEKIDILKLKPLLFDMASVKS